MPYDIDAELGLDSPRSRRSLPLLDSLRVASPCTASWDAMVGNEQVRFCGSCAKNVYNLSAMSREEATELVRSHESDMCVRMFQRADGTVMTQDCPVGVRKRRIRRAVAAAVGGSLMAAGALAFVSTRLGERCGAHGAVMGGVTALPTPVSEPGLQMAESESVSPTRSEPASSHESAGGVRVGRTAARPPAPAVMGTVAAPQPASPPPRATMGVMRRVD